MCEGSSRDFQRFEKRYKRLADTVLEFALAD